MFKDREDAARLLAARLRGRAMQNPLVLGIPRGGVVIGATLARELGADLDVVLARKLRAPHQPELAIGAIGEDGSECVNPEAHSIHGLTPEYLEQERRRQLEEISRRKAMFRSVRPAAPVAGRTVIVTDDGIATGSTMVAALQALRLAQPHELITAVPVAPPDRLEEVGRWCDEVVCLLAPEDFYAIGQFYRRFEQVDDARVVELLRPFAPPEDQPGAG